jgi:hypothetical protein
MKKIKRKPARAKLLELAKAYQQGGKAELAKTFDKLNPPPPTSPAPHRD